MKWRTCKPYFLDIGKALGVLILLMLVIAAILGALGEFRFDSYEATHGLYSSPLVNLPAYYNPLFELIWLTETIGLIALPFVLFIFRKWLRVLVLPWVIVAIVLLVSTFTLPFYPAYNDAIDPTLSSVHGYLLIAEGLTLATIFFSYLVLIARENRSSSNNQGKRQPR